MLRTIQTAFPGSTLTGSVSSLLFAPVLRLFAALLTTLLVAGCTTDGSDTLFSKPQSATKLGERKAKPPEKMQRTSEPGKWSGLKKGMGPGKVRQLLGEPEMVIVSKDRTYWYYANGGSVDFDVATTRVRFWNNPKPDAPPALQAEPPKDAKP